MTGLRRCASTSSAPTTPSPTTRRQAGAISEGFGDYWAVTVGDVVSRAIGVPARTPLPCVERAGSGGLRPLAPAPGRRAHDVAALPHVAVRAEREHHPGEQRVREEVGHGSGREDPADPPPARPRRADRGSRVHPERVVAPVDEQICSTVRVLDGSRGVLGPTPRNAPEASCSPLPDPSVRPGDENVLPARAPARNGRQGPWAGYELAAEPLPRPPARARRHS